MACYCIKIPRVEIERITSDYFRINDRSEPVIGDYLESTKGTYSLKVITALKEEFEVEVPLNGAVSFSSAELGICELSDGCYCFEIDDGCGEVKRTKQIFCYHLKCKLDNYISKSKDPFFKELDKKFELMKYCGEYGFIEEAEKIYDHIDDCLARC